jgi:hypothetical protein
MTKEELAEYLRKKGYDAVVEEGTVHVLVDEPMSKKEHRKFEKDIKESGYNSSYGWRRK